MAVIDQSNMNSRIIVSNQKYVQSIEKNGFDFISKHADEKSREELAAFRTMFGNGSSYIREDDEESYNF